MEKNMKRSGSRKKKRSVLLPALLAVLTFALMVAASAIRSQNDVIEEPAEKETAEAAEKTYQNDVQLSGKDAEPPASTAEPEDTTIPEDVTPPVISGAKDITVTKGESVSYKSGVTVTDDSDPSPKLSVDNSRVDLDHPGEYEVVYTATDSSGNASSVSVTLTVEEKEITDADTQRLYDKADALLAQILTDDMSDVEECFAIWSWVRKHVPWYGGSVEHDPVDQALKGLDGNAGDCYTDTVTCQVLLERAGFECIFMQRSPGYGYHYWLMVKVDGNWYHMDPAPIYLQTFICFLGTDAQLKWFSEEKRPDYYTHDTEGIPTTPDEPLATATYEKGTYHLKED
ncbi:MAG: transglutaminase domain-containing protein [Firmicutes bacterium]|nr:transglutaminase domain-containing protein [Bacillota bacterium]MBQ3578253.1 transglutaminase domain-containing protein [Bacillota bacterium]MBQ4234297.1 transglutaminase domain-containing protein [Bacillota bacterium]MBQ6259926.1 transglutaminase domain-containing protein [Bacillota bacterium]MBR0115382.1 transglutaminase domain-containing protein [Bacillota bacterium]